MINLFRKRLIPYECIELKDDRIIYIDDAYIVTTWETLHPKCDFSHGTSLYFIKEGWKISRFFKPDNSLLYIYCDIIDTQCKTESNDSKTYIFTDLLADVIIENNGIVRVVDLDEMADACSSKIISDDMLVSALHHLDKLLSVIYSGEIKNYLEILDRK